MFIWNYKPKPTYKIGDSRIQKRFIWWPTRLPLPNSKDEQYRWLGFYLIKERLTSIPCYKGDYNAFRKIEIGKFWIKEEWAFHFDVKPIWGFVLHILGLILVIVSCILFTWGAMQPIPFKYQIGDKVIHVLSNEQGLIIGGYHYLSVSNEDFDRGIRAKTPYYHVKFFKNDHNKFITKDVGEYELKNVLSN